MCSAEARHPGVLITRPEPGCAETARAAAALGWLPLLAPGLELRPVPFTPPSAQALLLTSRAAARGRFTAHARAAAGAACSGATRTLCIHETRTCNQGSGRDTHE